jgi:phage tail sheath protein FI
MPAELLPGDDSRPDLPITPVSTAVTAFVGRTLKGPVGEPVRITSFAQFQQLFGGLWQPAPLSYAVDQFFENGGEDAIVVRVVSGGRAPTLDLPCGAEVLTLLGRCPGSREYLRASVDYDGLPHGDPNLFNLVVQRVRSPGSELVEEQEIHRRLSVDAGSARHVAVVLDESRLVRVVGPAPVVRPDITLPADPRSMVGYVGCNADGDDGAPLSDYDVIGNEAEHTGLHALNGAAYFSLLCVPPLTREQDVGMSTLLVAGRLCRRLHALLVVDPPEAWVTPERALDGMRRWPFHSSDALLYVPRLQAQDRLRGRPETFASCGAVAGMLARRDRLMPVWQAEEGDEVPLRPSLRPACALSDDERLMLANYGVNTFGPVRREGRRFVPRSLGATLGAALEPRLLAGRRLALLVTASIERGTRWVVYGTADAMRRAQVAAQVVTMLEGLAAEGAFAAGPLASFVICDERLNGPGIGLPGEFRLLYGYAPLRSGEFTAFLTTHRPAASQTRAVTVSRLLTMGDRVDVEIQTSILRALTL